MNKENYLISSTYKFQTFSKSQLKDLSSNLLKTAKKKNLRGLFILSQEGFNISFSGKPQSVLSFKKKILDLFKLKQEDLDYKDNFSSSSPFFDLKIKIKEEIVGLYRKDIFPNSENEPKSKETKEREENSNRNKTKKDFTPLLSPSEWQKKLKHQNKNHVLLDIRNEYEVEIGKFKEALHLPISEFNEFPYAIKELQTQKDKEFMIYCTGGIRCEKAALIMKEQGFKKVSQLQGGILNYLASYPNEDFEGECFVFDHRVAVDQKLKPSQSFHICPHCGNPGKRSILCLQCSEKGWICERCYLKEEALRTCSKNCAHHFIQGHKSKEETQKKLSRQP